MTMPRSCRRGSRSAHLCEVGSAPATTLLTGSPFSSRTTTASPGPSAGPMRAAVLQVAQASEEKPLVRTLLSSFSHVDCDVKIVSWNVNTRTRRRMHGPGPRGFISCLPDQAPVCPAPKRRYRRLMPPGGARRSTTSAPLATASARCLSHGFLNAFGRPAVADQPHWQSATHRCRVCCRRLAEWPTTAGCFGEWGLVIAAQS